MAKIIKDVPIYGCEKLSKVHYALRTRLSCPPRWGNKQNLTRQGNTLQEIFKVPLLNYKSTNSFYDKRNG